MNDFEGMLRDMFSSIWDCEIDHPLWQDTVGEIMTAVIQAHEKCMPEPCEDAVSRQAALIALRKCQTYLYDARDPELKIKLSSAEAAINNLPTIQSQSTTGQLNDSARSTAQSTDLIDRQAAIRWVKTECNQYGKPTLDFESGKKVIEHLEQMPPAQPEPKEGHWIPHESPDGGEQYECSECGVLWEFTEGTPEDNEAYYCPKCGAKMTISTK